MKKLFSLLFLTCLFKISISQNAEKTLKDKWVDSVFNTLTDDEKIAQLMVIRAHSNLGIDHITKVENDIKKFNVGGLCFFQGGPIREAMLTNHYQQISKTPLLITIDGEWGLGMRLDSVTKYPFQMTLGAIDDENLVYKMGMAVGAQCKRMGIQVNYAPVVDVNNNPDNPVIGFRSFGENKNKVALFGIAYMKGMQDAGIMACAKHFPGHGDVSVDSHLDLPVINKSIAQLNETELYPFKQVFNAGIGSVMIAHLYIPGIDSTKNLATSLSKNNVTGLLRDSLHFKGLTFTDALGMKGVAKFFPNGTIAAQALIAGNDMLCLPESVPDAIFAIKKAIEESKLSWFDINEKVKKILAVKYTLGLSKWKPIDTTNLIADLNIETNFIRSLVAKKSITQLNGVCRLPDNKKLKIAYLAIGVKTENNLAKNLKNNFNADVYFLSYRDSIDKKITLLNNIIQNKYDKIIVGIHDYSNRPANDYGISAEAMEIWKKLNTSNTITCIFGNVLAIKNFCDAKNLLACYQDDELTQEAAYNILTGKENAKGTLPVTVCNYKSGFGIVNKSKLLKTNYTNLFYIDTIINEAISKQAFPGCVVLVAHQNKIIYEKAFGHTLYNNGITINTQNIFDLASVTKTSATTLSIMKLYEEGKINLQQTLGHYLPWVKGSNKENLIIKDILLHEAGLTPFISFYKETIDTLTGKPLSNLYNQMKTDEFGVRVAQNIYLRNDWKDTMLKRILQSPLSPRGKYVYSDNDFIFLGNVIEKISGLTLDNYVQQNFYTPMHLKTTGFKPRNRFSIDQIVPTETEKHFRMQTLQGDVHDEGAAMFGGVAGHAGLFSNAEDLYHLYEMLLNEGWYNGKKYFNPKTIQYFTSYNSSVSRRGLGFDKPEKDNAIEKDPYPNLHASPLTYGHTGYTGICVWVDPTYKTIFIFLSNRVQPTRNNNNLSKLNIRSRIAEVIYKAIGVE